MVWEFVRTGAILEDEECVYEDSYDTMDNEDFEQYFSYQVSYTDLLNWARSQDGFYEHFNDEITRARDEFIQENYIKIEEEE